MNISEIYQHPTWEDIPFSIHIFKDAGEVQKELDGPTDAAYLKGILVPSQHVPLQPSGSSTHSDLHLCKLALHPWVKVSKTVPVCSWRALAICLHWTLAWEDLYWPLAAASWRWQFLKLQSSYLIPSHFPLYSASLLPHAPATSYPWHCLAE